MNTQIQAVYFDIDNTLFDTKCLVRQFVLPAFAEKTGWSQADLQTLIKDYQASLPRATAFDPDVLLEKMATATNQSVAQLTELFFTPAFYQGSLFPETLEVLEKVVGVFPSFLYSEAVEKWQEKKIELSGIGEFFEQKNRIVTIDKLAPEILAKIQPESVIIDDNPSFIGPLAQNPAWLTVWIVREQPEPTNTIPSQVPRIGSLRELLPLLGLE